ncbi:hypothetical protein ISN45_At03g025080 [Arabidopsis thaliana x Arabidopsis arenosa]|uniref:Uncharacterized protein n=1 Tax=Arabidopsis thaliana x Arabidopsis arenosa TaxID=1240361 RepID=A0A8T2EQZ5_9BRAS|nr:hypothetical protein ISN45_At03g025080 [Arabidopsis thaliana x Arabidopsis arenosa]
MRCVTSFVVLCILMFLVVNNVEVDVKAQRRKPVCKLTGVLNPGKCPTAIHDASNLCSRKLASPNMTFKRCDCQNTEWRGKDHYQCTCYIKLPCNQ